MFFPSPSPCKNIKDPPNNIPENMIATQNTQGRYIPIFLVVLINTTPAGPARRFYPDLSWYHIIHIFIRGYYILDMLRWLACNTHTYILK